MPLVAAAHQQRIRQQVVTFAEYDYSTDPDKTLTVLYRPEVYADRQQQIADEITVASAEIDRLKADDSLTTSERRTHIQEINRHHSRILFSLFGEALVDWDLFEDEEQQHKVPLTPESFERFQATVTRITQVIDEENTRPNRQPSRGSNGRSSRS